MYAYLNLRIKVNPRFSVKQLPTATGNALLISTETEHRQWYRDPYIHSDLACFYLFLELRSYWTGGSIDSSAVTVRIGIYKIYCRFQCGNGNVTKDGSEEFGRVGDIFDRVGFIDGGS